MTGARIEPAERPFYLLMLAGAPAIWMLHLLMSYATVSVWCARVAGPGGVLGTARVAIAWYTVFALVGIVLLGWSGYIRHRHGTEALPHDSDTPAGRHRFLGFATLLLACLSAVATIYVATSAIFLQTCL